MFKVINVTYHEMIKCNLTLKNIFKVTHFQKGCGPGKAIVLYFCIMNMRFLFILCLAVH